MSDKAISTELPAPMANTTMIFVCILLILWFLKAFRRLARTILLRRSLIFGNVAQVRGLSSYLSYFDGATRAHLNSVVQTRQSKPAVPLEMLYIACGFDSVQLVPSSSPDIALLSVRINVVVPGKLFLLSNFDADRFKACVHQQCLEAARLSRRHAPDIGVLLRERVFAPDRSAGASPTGNGVTTLPLLATQEVCLRDGYVHELPTAGAHTVNVAIKSPYASLVGPEDKSTYNVALCFVPEPGLRDSIAHVVFPRPQTDGPRHRSAAATAAATAAAAAVDHRDDDGDDVLALKQSRDGTQSLLGSASSDQNQLDHRPLTQGSRFRGKPSTSAAAGGPAYAYAARGSDVGVDGVSPTSFASRLLEAWTAPWRHNIFTLRPTDAPVTRTGGPAAAVGVAGDNAATDLEANATPAAGSDTPTTPTLQQFPASAYPSQVAPAVVFSFPVPRHLPSLFATAASSSTAASPTPPGAAPKPRVRRDIHPRDVITIDTRGRLYTSMEIFGLGALPHAEAPATSTGADAAAAPASPSGPLSPRSAVAAPAPVPPAATFLAPETLSNHPSRVTPMASPSTSLRHQSGEMALRDSDAVELSHIVGDRGTANPQQVRPAGPSAATADDSNGTTAAATAAAAAPAAAPAVSSLALAQGGAFSGEECVVCLTDPKEILLLPCRHLCVCASCFVFVDKCPVCRALSSEYVAIQSGTKVPFQPVRR